MEGKGCEFWGKHDSIENVDWDAAEPLILAKLKPALLQNETGLARCLAWGTGLFNSERA